MKYSESDPTKKEPVQGIHVNFYKDGDILDCTDDELQQGVTNANGVINCPNTDFEDQELLRVEIVDKTQTLRSFDKNI